MNNNKAKGSIFFSIYEINQQISCLISDKDVFYDYLPNLYSPINNINWIISKRPKHIEMRIGKNIIKGKVNV